MTESNPAEQTILGHPRGLFMLFFTEMHGTIKAGNRAAAKFDSVAAGSPLLVGISSKVQSRIVNWDL